MIFRIFPARNLHLVQGCDKHAPFLGPEDKSSTHTHTSQWSDGIAAMTSSWWSVDDDQPNSGKIVPQSIKIQPCHAAHENHHRYPSISCVKHYPHGRVYHWIHGVSRITVGPPTHKWDERPMFLRFVVSSPIFRLNNWSGWCDMSDFVYQNLSYARLWFVATSQTW